MAHPLKACRLCGNKVKQLKTHYRKAHGTTPKQVSLDLDHDGVHPTCACGCGELTAFVTDVFKFQKYVGSHGVAKRSSAPCRTDKRLRRTQPWSGDDGTTCFAQHAKHRLPCIQQQCRQWIDCSKHCNCTQVMIADNGRVPCTLQQVGDVYGVTRMAINLQIKDSLFPKLMMLFKKIIRDVKTVDDTSTR